MTGFLLDTNVVSQLVRPDRAPTVEAWIDAQDIESLYLSVVSFGELQKGITILPHGKRRAELEVWLETDLAILFSGRILEMTRSIAEKWGYLEGQRQLIGRPLHVPDAQIAATAIEHRLAVVTRNVKDFERLGVDVINPWDESR